MKVIVIGGYGNFGKRLVYRLLKNDKLSICIAGRSGQKAKAFCRHLSQQLNKTVDYLELDVLTSNLVSAFKNYDVDIVVNASGPYQDQYRNNDYRVARACIDAPCHYVDLADARQFVADFAEHLDGPAKDANVMLVSGASTVPGLTTAVIDNYLPQFKSLSGITYGISPGNRTERGLGTISSILSYTGKPFSTLLNGNYQSVYGWQDTERYDFGAPLGKRWMGNCDIPDLVLLPQRYPSLQSMRFKAGLEVTLLHGGLWLLSGLSRAGLVRNWSRYARALTKMSKWFIHWGSDSGGMFVELSGTDYQDQPKKILWQLVAEDGTGPNVPIISAELIVNRIADGREKTGAMPCMGLFTLEEFFSIASYWNIYQKEASPPKATAPCLEEGYRYDS